MSALANLFLEIAKSIAEARNSTLAIRVKEHEIDYKFKSKNGSDKHVYESFYDDGVIYLGKSANPVKLNVNPREYDENQIVDVLDNAVTTDYYATAMRSDALKKIFDVSGPKQEQMIKLMYACLAGIALIGVLLMAMYGGQ